MSTSFFLYSYMRPFYGFLRSPIWKLTHLGTITRSGSPYYSLTVTGIRTNALVDPSVCTACVVLLPTDSRPRGFHPEQCAPRQPLPRRSVRSDWFRYLVIISGDVQAFLAAPANQRGNHTSPNVRCHYTLTGAQFHQRYTYYYWTLIIFLAMYASMCTFLYAWLTPAVISIWRENSSCLSQCYVRWLSPVDFMVICRVQEVQWREG